MTCYHFIYVLDAREFLGKSISQKLNWIMALEESPWFSCVCVVSFKIRMIKTRKIIWNANLTKNTNFYNQDFLSQFFAIRIYNTFKGIFSLTSIYHSLLEKKQCVVFALVEPKNICKIWRVRMRGVSLHAHHETLTQISNMISVKDWLT